MAKKTRKEDTLENKTLAKMQELLEVLQNLFILEAAKADVPSADIRKILHIDKKRIGTISKHVKPEGIK